MIRAIQRIAWICALSAALGMGCGVFGPPQRPDRAQPGAGANATCGDKDQH
ncbi:MAG: hypothetical protein ACE5IL_04465 [Myxococcota bacterium]